ncbi:MAG: hypothetical protein WA824_02760 [Candidatus Sulfotelmatobacter sp.]
MILQDEIRRAQELGQSLEDLVVNAGQITIKTEGSQLLIGFWSLICDYQKGLLNLLLWKFYASAFAQWRPTVEAIIRAHLSLMLPKEHLDKLKNDKYKMDFKKVPREIDEAFGLGKVFQNFLPEPVTNALHSYTHSGVVPLRRRFDGMNVAANYPPDEILALINTTASAVFMVTSLVTRHFEFEKQWSDAQKLYGDWAARKQGETRPPEGI